MRYSLATLIRRTRNPRRSSITFRPIIPPATLATNLYRAAYARIIAAWTERAPAIVAEYERSLLQVRDGLTTDSVDDLSAIIGNFGDALSRLVLTLTPDLRAWALSVEKWHRGKWRGAVLTATGIDLETILLASGEPQSVAEYVNWNVALVKDVNAQIQQRISSAVFSGFTERRPPREVSKTINEAVGLGKARSLRIASDQMQKLSAGLDQERQVEAGIDQFQWRHSRKLHPRAYHRAREGKVYPWKGNDLNGDLPGRAPYCGCRALAYLDLEDAVYRPKRGQTLPT